MECPESQQYTGLIFDLQEKGVARAREQLCSSLATAKQQQKKKKNMQSTQHLFIASGSQVCIRHGE